MSHDKRITKYLALENLPKDVSDALTYIFMAREEMEEETGIKDIEIAPEWAFDFTEGLPNPEVENRGGALALVGVTLTAYPNIEKSNN